MIKPKEYKGDRMPLHEYLDMTKKHYSESEQTERVDMAFQLVLDHVSRPDVIAKGTTAFYNLFNWADVDDAHREILLKQLRRIQVDGKPIELSFGDINAKDSADRFDIKLKW